MHDATMQGSPRKKFNKIRELNRRRNYFTKKVRNALRVGVAKALWDRRRRQPVDLSSAKTVLLMRNEGAVGDVVVDSALVKCLHQSGYIVDFLLTTSNSQVMRYNPRIRIFMKLTRSRPLIFCVNLIITFLATLLMNWLIISTILLLTLRCSIFPCIACGFSDK